MYTTKDMDYQRLLTELEVADNVLKPTHKKGIFLTGPSKVGKTTFLYHLLNKTLLPKQFNGQQVFEPEQQLENAMILHKPVSTTRLPNIIPWSTDIFIVDLPGFEDTEPQARVSNSFYIRKAMKCFSSASFVFVIDSDSAFCRHRNPDFEESLNTFGGMFKENGINNVKNRISLCVSKAEKGDSVDDLIKTIREGLSMENLNPNAQQILSGILQSKNINFFYKPSCSSQQKSGSDLVEDYNHPSHDWQIINNQINFHVLMKQGAETNYNNSARGYCAKNSQQHKQMFGVLNRSIKEIIEKRNQKVKDYLFIKEIHKIMESPDLNIYRLYPVENGIKVSSSYFPEYRMIKAYYDAVESVRQKPMKADDLEQRLPLVLKAILKYARLSEAEAALWKKFMYMFNSKRRQIEFLRFLLVEPAATLRQDRDFFVSEYRKKFQAICETLKIDQNVKDERYYSTALEILEPIEITRGGDVQGERGDLIIQSMVLCYKKLGDVSRDLHFATSSYCKALIFKRKLMPHQNRQQHLCQQAELCSKIGNKLFEAEMYNHAIDFFRVSNNFTMVCKCNLIVNTDCHTLFEVGDYCASILQFERATEMYQRAFEETSSKKTKIIAWKRILELRKNPQEFISKFEKKISDEELVGCFEKPEEALSRINLAFKVLQKKRESSKVSIQSIEEELNIIERQLKAGLL